MSDINILSCLHINTTSLQEAKVIDETQDSIAYEVKTRKMDVVCPNCKHTTSLIKDYTTKTYSFMVLVKKPLLSTLNKKD